ncbi:hypothetical protein B484DRAFT_438174 [Ochromonadaceae sp. CCMP2298]|nr:hypothetical protein B484DRAFT_438174 [Ochromonadaceae sp. CCMP2298]
MEQFCALSRTQLASPAKAVALQAAEELLLQCYGHTKQYQKVVALHTAQFDFHSRTLGEYSEESITALNSRAMYHFALKDFDKSKEDHKSVYVGLCKLQGTEHEETTGSLDGFKKLYADHQMTFEL